MKLFIFCLSVFCLVGCRNTATTSNTEEHTASVTFSPDSAYLYIQTQVDFGARVPKTEPHQKCGNYLVSQLARFGAQITEQKATVTAYDGNTLPMRNIIGSYRPEAQKRVLLCAHWDCRPWADHDADQANHRQSVIGANDGASGVGVLLEIARQLGEEAPNVGVDIIFFDVEDYGTPEFYKKTQNENTWCLGSQYWAKNPHKVGYKANYGILLDMVGAPDATFPREYFSNKFAPQVVSQVWNTAQAYGFGQFFINENVYPITDDHYFVNTIAHIPCIDIIHYNGRNSSGFADYWHTVNDDMRNISKTTLDAVGRTVLAVVRNEQ